MNATHRRDLGNRAVLRRRLGRPETAVVLGEVPIAWEVRSGRAGVRIPDLLIAFRIRRAQVIERKGYAIREPGKPPDFVPAVASDHAARHDEIGKLPDYAAFGIAEYWLFDPDRGLRRAAGLVGWRRQDGGYAPIRVVRYGPGMCCGWSRSVERHAHIAAEAQRDEAQAEIQRLRDEIARRQRAAGAS